MTLLFIPIDMIFIILIILNCKKFDSSLSKFYFLQALLIHIPQLHKCDAYFLNRN